MGLRHAENGHDRVADEFLECAPVLRNHFASDRVIASKEDTHVLWVVRLAHRGGAAHVGEEDRDDATIFGHTAPTIAQDGGAREYRRAGSTGIRFAEVRRP